MTEPTYIVAGCKSWNQGMFNNQLNELPGQWHYFASQEELTVEALRRLHPRFVFFLHWSHKVPADIIAEFECVCFHMTDLPYGRGGSPLQNLILRGHRDTKLTALRMVEAFDAGPVYLKKPLSLAGSAREILARASMLSAEMIKELLSSPITPVPQIGEPTIFKRRKPSESAIPAVAKSEALYDFIRMLDGEGYPPAFLEHAGFRYEFTNAAFHDGQLSATVSISAATPPSP
jgi:methionyl-tRNA formyltransferase